MAADTRLQSWAVAISGEGGLTGFPRNIHTREHLARSPLHDYSNVQIVHLPKQTYHKIFAQWMLIFDTCRVVTMVIFGGSVLHHALNAQQFIYSYAPHKPTSLSRCCQELPWRYRFLAWLLRSSPISNFTFRWMPPPGKDISWQWIKDALPSLKQQETLYFTVLIIIISFKFNKSKVQRCWWV